MFSFLAQAFSYSKLLILTRNKIIIRHLPLLQIEVEKLLNI
jgi:hypothetical protein